MLTRRSRLGDTIVKRDCVFLTSVCGNSTTALRERTAPEDVYCTNLFAGCFTVLFVMPDPYMEVFFRGLLKKLGYQAKDSRLYYQLLAALFTPLSCLTHGFPFLHVMLVFKPKPPSIVHKASPPIAPPSIKLVQHPTRDLTTFPTGPWYRNSGTIAN